MPSPAKLMASASGVTPDPQFRNVTLLLHGDGSNGAQNNTFLDSSSNNFTVTRNGNTTQGSFSPYGSRWSNYFDGSGDYITSPDNAAVQFGSGDFTVELWVNFSSTSGTQVLLGTRANTGVFAPYQLYYTGGVLYLYGSTNGSSWNIFNGLTVIPSVAAGTWYHIALVRSGSNFSTYCNGVRQANATVSGSLLASGAPVTIGSDASGASPYTGYISDLRMVKANAVYDPAQSSITVPTAPLTAITNTSLLTCQSNRFRDASTNNFAITRNGDVRVTPFSPYAPTAPYSAAANGGSMYFDGTGDWLTGSSSIMPSTSTSTFTIEGWVYPTTFANRIDIIGDMSPSVSSDTKVIAAEVNTSGQVVLYWYDGGIRRCTGSTSMVRNQWNYFAIVVSNNAIAIYVNRTTADTLSGTTTLTNRTQTHNFALGSYYGEPAFRGHLSNIRVSTVARTISAVPTAPLSSDANTRLLLNGTNAAIFDSAADNNLETVGNAQISTSVKKFGTGSMAFDGSGDYLSTPTTSALQMNGSFTWEAWVYPLSLPSAGNVKTFWSQRATLSNFGGPLVVIDSAGNLQLYIANAAASLWSVNGFNTGLTISLNTWQHLALVKNGTTLTLYKNGVAGSSTTHSTAVGTSGNTVVMAGAADGGQAVDGYIDDFRITNGVARYTANFTPPAAPFPDQ